MYERTHEMLRPYEYGDGLDPDRFELASWGTVFRYQPTPVVSLPRFGITHEFYRDEHSARGAV
jgi:hypothetical protein